MNTNTSEQATEAIKVELAKTHLVMNKVYCVSENQVMIDELINVIATKLFGHCSSVVGNEVKKEPIGGFFGIANESLEDTFTSQSCTIEKLKEINELL